MESSASQPHDLLADAPASAEENNAEATLPVTYPAPSLAGMRRDGLLAFGVAVFYLLFFQVSLRVPFGHISLIVLSTMLALCLTLLLTVCVARAIRSSGMLVANLLLSGALVAPAVLIPILIARFQFWGGWEGFLLSKPHLLYREFILFPGLRGLLLVWFAASIGVILSRLVREFKILLPMAVALAMVDLYVVFGGGLVAQANTGGAPIAKAAMQALTVNLPRPKIEAGGVAPLNLSVGFADYLFIALFFACFARFNIPSQRTFYLLCGTLAGYMLLVAFTQTDLPALIPIAVVVIGCHLRRFRYDRQEAFALLYAGLIVCGVLGALWFRARH